MYSHREQCSFSGVYQPPLPYEKGPFGKFFLFGGYNDIWSFLNLSSTSTLREFKKRGEMICNMDFVQITKYNIALGGGDSAAEKRVGDLPEMCFLASYTYTMLFHGYGFGVDRELTSTGKVEYQGVKLKIGWPLGAMLYEINTLPWIYEEENVAASSFNDIASSSSTMMTTVASHENHLNNLMNFVVAASSSRIKKKIDIIDDDNDVRLPTTLHDQFKVGEGSKENISKKDSSDISERVSTPEILIVLLLMMVSGIVFISTLFSKAGVQLATSSYAKTIFNSLPIVCSASSHETQHMQRRENIEKKKLDVSYGSIVAYGTD